MCIGINQRIPQELKDAIQQEIIDIPQDILIDDAMQSFRGRLKMCNLEEARRHLRTRILILKQDVHFSSTISIYILHSPHTNMIYITFQVLIFLKQSYGIPLPDAVVVFLKL